MRKGILIVNGFVQEKSFVELRDALQNAASDKEIALDTAKNCDLLFELSEGKPLFAVEQYEFGIFWDKDLKLARQLEKGGLRLFNSAQAIALCDDKTVTHAQLQNKIPMPKTIPVPTTYRYVGYGDMAFLDTAIQVLGLPLVIKECSGSFGKQVYLAHTREEAAQILRSREAVPMLMQEFIRESVGRDLRLYVVGGKVKAAMVRRNETDFRANIAAGGRAETYVPTRQEQELAERAVSLLGLDFAGVDLLWGKEGPLLCEVNSNAHFKGISQCTGTDIPGAILEHIQNSLTPK